MLLLASVVVEAAPVVEEFVLKDGGRVTGELLNPKEVPRQSFRIKTASGAVISLAPSAVAQKRTRRPEEVEYEKIWPRYADTVEGQWAIAEWCRQHTLLDQRKRHLERILELDPNHEKARRALGYFEHQGEWTTQEKRMSELGYVWQDGQWRLPQEIQLEKEQRRAEEAQTHWQQEIALYRRWLGGKKSQLAEQKLRAIDDPYAVKALAKALNGEPNEQVRMLYIEVLAKIGNTPAAKVLALWAMREPLEEVRLSCLDQLQGNQDAVGFFIGRLASADNAQINRAAFCLGHLGDPAAIGPLVNALTTTHKIKIEDRNPGQMTTTFNRGGGGGGGLSMGGGPKVASITVRNRAVLEALVALAGGPNFGFDVSAWKSWQASQRRYAQLDARRD